MRNRFPTRRWWCNCDNGTRFRCSLRTRNIARVPIPPPLMQCCKARLAFLAWWDQLCRSAGIESNRALTAPRAGARWQVHRHQALSTLPTTAQPRWDGVVGDTARMLRKNTCDTLVRYLPPSPCIGHSTHAVSSRDRYNVVMMIACGGRGGVVHLVQGALRI